MKLLIDDCPRRIRLFQEAFGSGVRTASSFSPAIGTMGMYKDGELSEIYLDHDGVGGEALANFIVSHNLHPSARYFIHSSNYAGAVKMRDILTQAGYDVEMVSFEDVIR